MRKLRTDFGRRDTPSAPYVHYLLKKVKETKREMPKTVHTSENIAAVAESVRQTPPTSIHHRSQQLNISESSLRRIMHKDQELKPIGLPMRFRFAKWACERFTEDADFGKKKKKHLFR